MKYSFSPRFCNKYSLSLRYCEDTACVVGTAFSPLFVTLNYIYYLLLCLILQFYSNIPFPSNTAILLLPVILNYCFCPRYCNTPSVTDTAILPLSQIQQYSLSPRYCYTPSLPYTAILHLSQILQYSLCPRYCYTPSIPDTVLQYDCNNPYVLDTAVYPRYF